MALSLLILLQKHLKNFQTANNIVLFTASKDNRCSVGEKFLVFSTGNQDSHCKEEAMDSYLQSLQCFVIMSSMNLGNCAPFLVSRIVTTHQKHGHHATCKVKHMVHSGTYAFSTVTFL